MLTMGEHMKKEPFERPVIKVVDLDEETILASGSEPHCIDDCYAYNTCTSDCPSQGLCHTNA